MDDTDRKPGKPEVMHPPAPDSEADERFARMAAAIGQARGTRTVAKPGEFAFQQRPGRDPYA